jgi:hypothetical protein
MVELLYDLFGPFEEAEVVVIVVGGWLCSLASTRFGG